jgi:uncharacterized membrane protein YdfJ with MMPL/SSD domain
MLLNVGLGHSSLDSQSGQSVAAMRDYLKEAPQGLRVYVSGQAGIYSDLMSSLTQSIDLTTIITVALVVALVDIVSVAVGVLVVLHQQYLH